MPRIGHEGAQLGDRGQTVLPRHDHVKQDDVGPELAGKLHRFDSIVRFPDHFHVLLK